MYTQRNILLGLILFTAICLNSNLAMSSNCKVKDCMSFCDYESMGDMSEWDYCIHECHNKHVHCVKIVHDRFFDPQGYLEAPLGMCVCDEASSEVEHPIASNSMLI